MFSGRYLLALFAACAVVSAAPSPDYDKDGNYVPNCSKPFDGKTTADYFFYEAKCVPHCGVLKRGLYQPDCSKPFNGKTEADKQCYDLACHHAANL